MTSLKKQFTQSSPLSSAYLQLLPLMQAEYTERLAIIADTGADSVEVELVSDDLEVEGFCLYWLECDMPAPDENAPDLSSTGRWPVLLQQGVELDIAFMTKTLQGLGIVPGDARPTFIGPAVGTTTEF